MTSPYQTAYMAGQEVQGPVTLEQERELAEAYAQEHGTTSGEQYKLGWAFRDGIRNEKPEVNMKVTLHYPSDSYAGTIIKVSADGRTFEFTMDGYARIDENGPYSEEQHYAYTANPQGHPRKAYFTVKGWRNGSCPVTIGYGRTFISPHM